MRPLIPALLVMACANPLGGPSAPQPTPPATPAPQPGPPPPAGDGDETTGVDHAPDGMLPLRPDRFCEGDGDLAQDAWERFAVLDDATECAISGWVSDPDPAGLNVRDAPGTQGKVLRTLSQSTFVRVVGTKGGWMLVCGARTGPDADLLPITGWVYASKLSVDTRGYERGGSPLHATKDKAAAAVATVPVEAAVELVGCDGSWYQARHQGKVGWLAAEDACPTPYTTCPM